MRNELFLYKVVKHAHAFQYSNRPIDLFYCNHVIKEPSAVNANKLSLIYALTLIELGKILLNDIGRGQNAPCLCFDLIIGQQYFIFILNLKFRYFLLQSHGVFYTFNTPLPLAIRHKGKKTPPGG